MKHGKLTKRLTAVVLAAGMVMSLGACRSGGNNSGDAERKDASQIVQENQVSDNSAAPSDSSGSDSSGASSASSETDQTAEGEKTQYPLTITTYGSDGQELTTTYEKAPEKVLAVYQGSIETMLALGLEDHIAGAAGLDNEVPDDQKSAFSTINYLDEFTPSLETVTMMEPDMIFSWGSLFGEKTLGDAQGWVDKGTNIYMNSNTRPSDEAYSRTLENEYTDILNIGKIFDVQDRANAIVQEMRDTIESVKEKTADMEEKPTTLILEAGDGSFRNYGATSLGGDMVTQLGGVLANPDGSSLGKEDLIAADPDVIFVVYMPYTGDDPEEVKNENLNTIIGDESLQSLQAVQNDRVVPIMLSEMYASATRTQDGIETFAKGLYPKLDLGE